MKFTKVIKAEFDKDLLVEQFKRELNKIYTTIPKVANNKYILEERINANDLAILKSIVSKLNELKEKFKDDTLEQYMKGIENK